LAKDRGVVVNDTAATPVPTTIVEQPYMPPDRGRGGSM
jgi:hypothetical protein